MIIWSYTLWYVMVVAARRRKILSQYLKVGNIFRAPFPIFWFSTVFASYGFDYFYPNPIFIFFLRACSHKTKDHVSRKRHTFLHIFFLADLTILSEKKVRPLKKIDCSWYLSDQLYIKMLMFRHILIQFEKMLTFFADIEVTIFESSLFSIIIISKWS